MIVVILADPMTATQKAGSDRVDRNRLLTPRYCSIHQDEPRSSRRVTRIEIPFRLADAELSHHIRQVSHTAGIAPLVVVPGDDLHQIALQHHR